MCQVHWTLGGIAFFFAFLLTDHAWNRCILLFSLKIIILNVVHKYYYNYIEHMNLTEIMIKLQSNNYYCKSGCCVHNFSVKLLCV